MASSKYFLLLLASIALASALPKPEAEIITQPEPGQEYVFVQSSASGARPIERKDKNIDQARPFETSHKVPSSLSFALNQEEDDEPEVKPVKGKKVIKREASPGGVAPAPAGAIKLDVRKLLEMYKDKIQTTKSTPTSTTAKPKSTTTRKRAGNKRIKKEARNEDAPLIATSPRPVLTTGAAVARSIDIDDIQLEAAGSEKQRTRKVIKKGPNGQDYEYEYVYYYYDDDEPDAKDNKKVTNSHDGPARNSVSRSDKSRGEKSSVEKSVEPEANEVLPAASRQRNRGRQLGEEETVNEERLPANTRFPPRSRNLNTTPLPEEEPKVTTRGRGRGRPSTEAPVSEDNVSDETQGSRGRTRANVRRPSLELVDNATFNTHTNTAGAEPSGGPSFPTELPAGPVRFLGATPNERMDLPGSSPAEEKPKPQEPAPVNEPANEPTGITADAEGTTVMSAMDKVALDLYAVVQGTQKLSGDDEASTEETDSTSGEDGVTTELAKTETVETPTTTTTSTTTTTTTPAPTTTTTTTTTTEAPTGKGRYRPRIGTGRRTTQTTSTEAAPASEKPKKFGRPGFNRGRLNTKTTPEPSVEADATKEESKPVSQSRPTLSRGRFGASRPRGRTTAAPAENNEESAASSTTSTTTRSRSRPSFNLRPRGRTTAAPAAAEGETGNEEAHESSASETVSTTVRSRRISTGNSVRPLRPGPRINLSGRRGAAHVSTTEAPTEDHVAGDEVPASAPEEHLEKESDAPAPVEGGSLHRLKSRKPINVQARPKAAASAPVQVRRVNPLLGRRRPGQTTEATSSEAPQEVSATEETQPVEETSAEEKLEPASSTTEEPRGLNKLLAGRRRLGVRQPGTTNH